MLSYLWPKLSVDINKRLSVGFDAATMLGTISSLACSDKKLQTAGLTKDPTLLNA